MNFNEQPVPAATEEGFTGAPDTWFDGKSLHFMHKLSLSNFDIMIMYRC